jgi:hypothetical protein
MLAPFLKGKDALAIEALHDQMLRCTATGAPGSF